MNRVTSLRFERGPLLVGIGGTPRPDSNTERALRIALAHARRRGMRTRLFGGAELVKLPGFNPQVHARTESGRELVEAVREADGVIIATPGYHGGVSGLVKNAIDLLEDLRDDQRAYLDGRAVGCIVTAAGWQGCNTALGALRSIIHALRGWPTPLGVTLNTADGRLLFGPEGQCLDAGVQQALERMSAQVLAFAQRHALGSAPVSVTPATETGTDPRQVRLRWTG